MDIREKAVRMWGHEDCRTIAICYLVEYGNAELAVQLFDNLTEKED